MFNFDFLEKGLVILSPPHFVYDFLKKDKVNFKNYDIVTSETNNYNTHIVQYLEN